MSYSHQGLWSSETTGTSAIGLDCKPWIILDDPLITLFEPRPADIVVEDALLALLEAAAVVFADGDEGVDVDNALFVSAANTELELAILVKPRLLVFTLLLLLPQPVLSLCI